MLRFRANREPQMSDVTSESPPVPLRRSRFLAGGALFAGVWLFAFGIDATISTIDGALYLAAGAHVLLTVRNLVAYSVLAFALPMLVALVFVPHLPKRIFLPPVLYVFWANIYPWPLLVVRTSAVADLLFNMLQLSVFAVALFQVWRRTGRLRLRASDLPVKRHLVRRTFIAFGATFCAALVAVPVLAGFVIAASIERQTEGYLRFTSKGVEARETTLTKGDRTVRLIGMVHIGDGDFYRDLFASFPRQSLVLVEGVSDEKGRLTRSFSYDGVARAMGLASQVDVQAAWIGKAARSGVAGEDVYAATGRADVIDADVDVSQFSDVTIRFLNDVGSIYGSKSVWQALGRIDAMDDRYSDKEVAAVFHDIIDRRNAEVVATFDREVAAHPLIVIPWGAQHMPGIEKALKERGFAVQSRRGIPVVDYRHFF